MAGPLLRDRVRETSNTTGTGTLTLAGAVAGFQSFTAVGDGNSCYYAIENRAVPTEWEVGIGTYTAAGTTLTRTTILASSNGGSAVNFSAGIKDVRVTFAASARYVDVQAFTSSGTWTKPPGAQVCEVLLIGGGGGGGSGRRGAAGTARAGGGGGTGGNPTLVTVPASVFGATESVTIGTGGAGGAAVTTDDTNGNNGSMGNPTTFGGLEGTQGGWGYGGTNANTTVSAIFGYGVTGFAANENENSQKAATGGIGSSTGSGGAGIKFAGGPSGGGGGGAATTTNTSGAGGTGGGANSGGGFTVATTAAGGAADGGSGSDGGTAGGMRGIGGGGGGGNAAGAGGNGGNGGNYGGGGGGGGASVNGFASGAGGNGGSGYALIITYCKMH